MIPSPIARVGDICFGICYKHAIPIPMVGKITTGSNTTYFEGKPVARIGDEVRGFCDHTGIIVASSTKAIDGKPVAKVGDKFVGDFTGSIITGASKSSPI